MKALAFDRIAVLTAKGLPDRASYIAAGDLCQIGEKTAAGLWPVTYPTKKGQKTRWVRSLKGFLVNQNNFARISYPAKGYEKATIKSSGCGVCSAIIALGAVTGSMISVQTMRDWAVNWGARVPGGTDMNKLLRLLSGRFPFRVRQTNDRNVLLGHLRAGGAAICNVSGKGMFSTGGHFMAVLGELGGKLCIADPGLYSGKYSVNARRRANVTVSRELIFASPAVLDADCVGRWPRYWLLEAKK